MRQYGEPEHSSDDPTARDRNLWNLDFQNAIAWGPTARLALFASIAPDYRFMSENTSLGRVTRSASGFEDTLLFARYTLYALDSLGQTLRIDPLAGFYLPTGWYNKSDSQGRLPPELQNGSGSVDPYFGVTTMWKSFYNEIDWDLTYRWNPSPSSGFQEGDAFHTDFAYYREVYPWPLADLGVPSQLWIGVESNVIWNGKDRIAASIDDATGGSVWCVDPGLFWGTPFWSTGAAIQLPVVQDLYGTDRLKAGWRLFVYFEYYLMMPSLHFG